jgi:hypothetical protein
MFGMDIDNKLNFNNHITTICKKINKQFNVMLRFRNLISKDTLLKLYKAFILCRILIIVHRYGTFAVHAIQIKYTLSISTFLHLYCEIILLRTVSCLVKLV